MQTLYTPECNNPPTIASINQARSAIALSVGQSQSVIYPPIKNLSSIATPPTARLLPNEHQSLIVVQYASWSRLHRCCCCFDAIDEQQAAVSCCISWCEHHASVVSLIIDTEL